MLLLFHLDGARVKEESQSSLLGPFPVWHGLWELPRDLGHLYGHGCMEFLGVVDEGGLGGEGARVGLCAVHV